MGFDTIPAIPADFPLYDWSDWQQSRDALAPGIKTKQFQIAAWNAIVDGLANAITAAGQTWDAAYTTAAGAKITVSDPKLYAAKFNSVRLNIDRQMNLDWPWAVRTDSRGYVGREDFQGRQGVGKACDLVYPEYILELVRKLNLLLEIMRGTGPVQYADTDQLIATQIDNDAKSGIGARVDCRHNASTVILTSGARSGKSVLTAAASSPKSICRTDVQPKASAPVSFNHNIPAILSAGGRSRFAAPAEPVPLGIHSKVVEEIIAVNRQRVARISAFGISGTVSQQDADVRQAISAAPDGMLNHSSVEAEPRNAQRLSATAVRISGSKAKAVGGMKRSRVLIPKGMRVQAAAEAELRGGLPLCAASETQLGSHVHGGAESHLTIPLPPSGVESRISGEVELRTGTPYPISAARNASTSTGTDVRAAPPFPLMPKVMAETSAGAELDNGLPSYVLASDNSCSASRAVLSEQKSAPSGCDRRSGTAVSCVAVDTGWLPPAWVNGGLWIRQVRDEPVQRENGELEVS